ncbi:MAG TPA: DUF3570 domain-containing protein [Labilithrix sp.]|nr:DUF3570 domain-containing protein [Labilithrix sp.]
MKATTTDARYFVDLGDRVIVWPHLRLHAQDGVDFWHRAYVGTLEALPAFRTGDRELGPLTNVTLGAGLRLGLGRAGAVDDWVLTTTVDGTWTSFFDALYVKQRLSGLAALGVEVAF